MDAILLAGGFGTRLRPLTYTRPKPLLPVAGRAMVEWGLDRLPAEVDRVLVTVNWLADELAEYFAASERDLEFIVVTEDEPLGTGGAVKNCEADLRSQELLVLNADIISEMDLDAQLALHREKGAKATIALKEVPEEDVVNYGVVQLDEDDPDQIRGFVEKPATPAEAPSRLINAGAYILDRSVLDLIPAGMVSMEKEVFPQILGDVFCGLAFDGYWLDVGDPVRLRAASGVLDETVWHGPGSTVDPTARVTDTEAGARVTIGADAVLDRCVLGDGVTVAPGAHLTDCVVGDDEEVAGEHHEERIWSRPVPSGYPDKQVGNVLPGTP